MVSILSRRDEFLNDTVYKDIETQPRSTIVHGICSGIEDGPNGYVIAQTGAYPSIETKIVQHTEPQVTLGTPLLLLISDTYESIAFSLEKDILPSTFSAKVLKVNDRLITIQYRDFQEMLAWLARPIPTPSTLATQIGSDISDGDTVLVNTEYGDLALSDSGIQNQFRIIGKLNV